MPVALRPKQLAFLQLRFTGLMARARAEGIMDQTMCEWMLSLAGRWLVAHGVPKENVHAWLEAEIRDTRSPVPIVNGARAKNDFGSERC